MAAKRTTHRSSAGKKLYAVRDAEGQFKDIQTYQRAHSADLRQTSQAEAATAKKKTAKKAAKKAAKPTSARSAGKKAAKKTTKTVAKRATKKTTKKTTRR